MHPHTLSEAPNSTIGYIFEVSFKYNIIHVRAQHLIYRLYNKPNSKGILILTIQK